MIRLRQIPELFRLAGSDASVGISTWSVGERLQAHKKSGPFDAAQARCSCALELAGYGEAYNEEAFQYLLAVERKRFERSKQPFVLALIELESRPGQPNRMHPAVSAQVFDGLTRSLRETDLVGWFRDGHIVGAVLTHLGDAEPGDVTREMSKRVTQALREQLPAHVGDRLRVRLYSPPERLDS